MTIQVGGTWRCEKCGESYHSSEMHTCAPDADRAIEFREHTPLPEQPQTIEPAICPDCSATLPNHFDYGPLDHCPRLDVKAATSASPVPAESPRPAPGKFDVANLRFYAHMAREFKWETGIISWGVIEQTLNEIANRYAALQATAPRE